jgi:hypothetical protein
MQSLGFGLPSRPLLGHDALSASGARTEEATMLEQSVPHEKAAAAILSGKLSARRPDSTWGGPATGAPCAGCDLPVTKSELEHELETQGTGGVEKASLTLHVHMRCIVVRN